MTNVKIPTDTSIPVGSILHVHKFGTDRNRTFTCAKDANDTATVSLTSMLPVVTGVTGLQGKPVYETGIDGIGFQVSDILRGKNGSLVAAEAVLVQRMCGFQVHQKDITLPLYYGMVDKNQRNGD
ncbi:hypothetical protein MJ565_02670 [Klebsiella pneumoniae]|nr:hypothetical protein MJ565_02670 [Klebsiella pneumoniae]